jgi:hypothetical protein
MKYGLIFLGITILVHRKWMIHQHFPIFVTIELAVNNYIDIGSESCIFGQIHTIPTFIGEI